MRHVVCIFHAIGILALKLSGFRIERQGGVKLKLTTFGTEPGRIYGGSHFQRFLLPVALICFAIKYGICDNNMYDGLDTNVIEYRALV